MILTFQNGKVSFQCPHQKKLYGKGVKANYFNVQSQQMN
mgnify:CR=1 FL=1